MQKTIYEDYKYFMQDTGRIYVGGKYTFGELLDDEEVSFKLRLILKQYIMPEADREDSLESHFYYLSSESFLVQIYKQLKGKVKVNVLEEKKKLFGGKQKVYVTKTLTVEELVKLAPSEKEKLGMVIQEFSLSKLAMSAL